MVYSINVYWCPILTPLPPPVAPNYTNPGPQTVTEGDTNVQLNVSVDANPFPSFFNWSRNGVLITSSGNVALTADSITFTRVQRDNAGTYTVYSNNTAGSDSTSFELTVQCKFVVVDIQVHWVGWVSYRILSWGDKHDGSRMVVVCENMVVAGW